jgi:peroxiredoxin Q/BCP
MASVDDLDTNKKFAAEHEVDFPILSDPDRAAGSAYGVLSPSGLARRWTFYIGGDGKILFIDKMVHAGTAGDDLAAKLEELASKGLIRRK